MQAVGQAQADDHWAVARFLEQISFPPRIMGVDEAEVWRKIEQLCRLYEAALTQQRGRAQQLARRLEACSPKSGADTGREDRANG